MGGILDNFNPDDSYKRIAQAKLPGTRRFHRALYENVNWYRAWHQSAWRLPVHVITALLVVVGSISVVATLLNQPQDTQAAAGIAELFPFQGRLTNPDGTVVADADYDIVFKLYTVDTGGSAVWTESHTGANDVSTVDGIFNVNLGSLTALSGVDFNQDEYYLGVEVETDGEMTPRIRLGAAPYAFNTDTIDGISSEEFFILDGQVGGQIGYGGTGAGDDLTLRSTSDTTKGNVILADDGGLVGVGTASPIASLQVSSGTLTSSTAAISQLTTATWNDAGTSFYGQLISVTNTASAATSFPLLVSVDSESVFGIDKFGNTFVQSTDTSLSEDFLISDTVDNATAIAITYSNAPGLGILGSSSFRVGRSRGTKATPAVVADGDLIGNYSFYVNDDNVFPYQAAATILARVDGTSGANDVPGEILFATSPDGSDLPIIRVSISQDGKVGIGNNLVDPANFLLEVAGDVGPNSDDTYDLGSNSFRWQDLYLGSSTLHIGTSVADEGSISFNTTTDTLQFNVDGTARLSVDDDGNVYVGTGALSTSAADGFLSFPSVPGTPTGVPTITSGRAPITWDSAGDTLYVYDGGWNPITGGGGGISGSGVSGQVTFWNGASSVTGENELFYDTGANELGIGLNTPEGVLHVFDATAGTVTANAASNIIIEDSSTNYLSFLAPDANIDQGILFGNPTDNDAGRILYDNDSDQMEFWTNGSEVLTIDNAGEVGLGDTTPDARLSVTSTGTSTGAAIFTGGTDVGTASANAGQIKLGSVAGRQGVLSYDYIAGDLYIDNAYNSTSGDINFRTRTSATANQLTFTGLGELQLGNNDVGLEGRNAANSAFIDLIKVGPTDTIEFGLTGTNITDFTNATASTATQQFRFQNPTSGLGNVVAEGALVAHGSNGFAASVASAGDLRLANDGEILWRNAGNTADMGLRLNAADKFEFDETALRDINFVSNIATSSPVDWHFETLGTGASNVIAEGSFVAHGADSFGSTSATTGALRIPNAQDINWRRAGSATDSGIGLDSSDRFVFDPVASAGLVLGFTSSSLTSTEQSWRFENSSTGVMNIVAEGALVAHGSNAFAASVASAGDLRLANDGQILWRNAGDSANLGLTLNTDNEFEWTSVSNAISFVSTSTNTTDDIWSFEHPFSGSANISIEGSLAVYDTNSFGCSPATTGAINLCNNDQIAVRNAGDTADISVIKLNSADRVEIGANLEGDLTLNGHLLPESDDAYDLGSSSFRWRDLYLGPTSLHLISKASETTTARDYAWNIQETPGSTQGDLRLLEGATQRLSVTTAGNFVVGNAALATSATVGFPYIPTTPGVPTGTPTSYSGRSPFIYDSSNDDLYFYNSGWQQIGGGGISGSGTAGQVTFWTGAATVSSDSGFTFDSGLDALTIGLAGSGEISVPGSGTRAEQFGAGASAGGTDSLAVGQDASATALNTIAVGHDSSATSTGNIAIGDAASATGALSLAIGDGASASSTRSLAIGESADASALQSIAIGNQATTAGGTTGGIAIGYLADAGDIDGIAIGRNASTLDDDQIAIGADATVTGGFYNIALGGSGTSVSGTNNSIAIGAGSDVSGNQAVAIGGSNDVSARGIALGFNADVSNVAW